MDRIKVDGRQVLEDIRSGLDDESLMKKYHLSAKGLESLYKKLTGAGVLKLLNARECIRDIARGMSHEQLMEKYNLSARALENLFIELSRYELLAESVPAQCSRPKVTIRASELVELVRSGMTAAQLMERYGITSSALEKVIQSFVSSGILGPDEIHPDLHPPTDDSLPLQNHRSLERYYLDLDVAICDAANPRITGKVRDITVEGIGIAGLLADVDETKTLLVLGDELGQVSPFQFEAVCRWVKKNDIVKDAAAGFQITNISAKDLAELNKLIKIATI